MNQIKNPILKGFNPDPSIIRVGDDYYVATSTFEWFPGVQIHHSRDLKNWKLITRPLSRVSQLDMRGESSSCGVWAPCLSYHDGLFYLIYSNVTVHTGIFKCVNNYLVTCDTIDGEWSEPIYLNSSGFDPSLFHDDDGTKWLLNMKWDYRPNNHSFNGIVLQQYSPEEQKLVGPIKNIFKGTDLQLTEAPHIYKRNGYYYLMTAEGGTEYNHAVTFARSKNIDGPYEICPQKHILTSKDHPDAPLQRTGHASIVDTQDGETYMTYLCGRPLPGTKRCTLGRETAIQKMRWTEDGWLELASGGVVGDVYTEAPNLKEHVFEAEAERDDFDNEELNIHYQTLRLPLTEFYANTKERKGYLRLRGSQSISSLQHQTLIARRQQHFVYEATTCIEFEPDDFQQMAGLVCFYNTEHFYYLKTSWDEELGKVINILACDAGNFYEPVDVISIEGTKRSYLRVKVDYSKLQFYYSTDEKSWTAIGPELDASILSDEYVGNHFTGAFVGLCCHDISGRKMHADFDYFEYKEYHE